MEVKRVRLVVAAAPPSSWSELPPVIVGQVLLRLPSLSDRVHFRAVCRPWRAGTRREDLPCRSRMCTERLLGGKHT
uniref:F-box domain-containing protein n=1 Tax=Leersia perrieri TaxID=77586 RepID=A0A0D9WQ92_9ORYZ